MKYIVAVSGGVDSIVLLDMLVRENKHDLIVAHFDHGIRQDSASDARFVAATTKRYGLPFEMQRKELGAQTSEEEARTMRYQFLHGVAEKYSGEIMTAHHLDDMVESIAINISRGTGWRGLAVLGNASISRPLLTMTKSQLYEYATNNNLEWVEDATNQQSVYLRNRLRKKIYRLLDSKTIVALTELRKNQMILRDRIDELVTRLLIPQNSSSRYFFTMVEDAVADELLVGLLRTQNCSLTRPQRTKFLHAIKAAAAGTRLEAGSGVEAQFTKREFIVKNTL